MTNRVCIYFAADYLGVPVNDLKWHPTFRASDMTVARYLIGFK